MLKYCMQHYCATLYKIQFLSVFDMYETIVCTLIQLPYVTEQTCITSIFVPFSG